MTNPAPFRAFSGTQPLEYPPALGFLEYTSWKDEQMSWKKAVYVGDWTFVPEIRFKGPDALKLISDLSINSVENWPIGKAKHIVQCNEDGKVITEGVGVRLGEDYVELNVGTPAWSYFKLKTGNYNAEAEFAATHKIQVSGPNSLSLLEKLTNTTLRDVKFMDTKVVQIRGLDVSFLRQGMAGEIGFELRGPIQNHPAIMQALLEAGQEFGIRQLGRRTVQINHLEACYPTVGIHYFQALSDDRRADFRAWIAENLPEPWRGHPLYDGVMQHKFSTSFMGSWDGDSLDELCRSPVEMGWGKSIKFDHDFIGRDALRKELESPRRKVVTLEFNSDDLVKIYASHFGDGEVYQLFEMPHAPYVSAWTDKIMVDGQCVGHATHPGYSYYFRRGLALSFIDVEFAEVGTEVTVLWGPPGTPQTLLRATVKPAPYKPDDRRADLSSIATADA